MSGSGASNLGYGNIAPLSNINGRYVNSDNSNSPSGFSSNEIPGSPPGNIAHGLAGAKSNVDAAAGYVPGICLFKGGAKVLKRKIKNITKKYKMKGHKRRASKKRRSMKKKLVKIDMMDNNRSPSMVNAVHNASKLANAQNISRAAARSVSASIARAISGGRRTRRQRRGSRRQRGGFTPPLPGNIPYPPGYSQYQNNLPLTPTYSVGGKLGPSDLALANPPPIKMLPGCTNCVDNYNHNTNSGFPSRGH